MSAEELDKFSLKKTSNGIFSWFKKGAKPISPETKWLQTVSSHNTIPGKKLMMLPKGSLFTEGQVLTLSDKENNRSAIRGTLEHHGGDKWSVDDKEFVESQIIEDNTDRGKRETKYLLMGGRGSRKRKSRRKRALRRTLKF